MNLTCVCVTFFLFLFIIIYSELTVIVTSLYLYFASDKRFCQKQPHQNTFYHWWIGSYFFLIFRRTVLLKLNIVWWLLFVLKLNNFKTNRFVIKTTFPLSILYFLHNFSKTYVILNHYNFCGNINVFLRKLHNFLQNFKDNTILFLRNFKLLIV